MAFKTPNAAKKPTLINAGTLGNFGGAVKSKTDGSPYYMETVELRPQGQGQKASFRLMWAPAFFAEGFDPSTLDRGGQFVYSKNINSADGPSLLEGLCGGLEAWDALQEVVVGLEDLDPQTIHDALNRFFVELGPVPFIYVLKQERKQDGFNEDGSKRYVLGQYYEVDSIQPLTDKSVKSLVKRQEANAKRIAKAKSEGKDAPAPIVFKFNPADFDIEVEVPGQGETVNA